MSSFAIGDWVGESLCEGWNQQIRVDQILASVQTPFQRLTVVENKSLGRVLVIDGRIQLTTEDEFVYHEAIAHVPIIAHGNVTKVLIIGGGDGGTMREVLRHPGVERVVLVDIDAKVPEFSREYLPSLHQGAFDNPKAEIIINDGTKYVKECSEQFDLIIIDSTDPEDESCPSSVLFQTEFYRHCQQRLRSGGLLVAQFGHPQFESYTATAIGNLSQVFPVTTLYTLCVPTYLGGLQCFALAAMEPTAVETSVEELEARWHRSTLHSCDSIRYYTPQIGRACFVLPKWLAKLLEQVKKDLIK